MTTGYQEEVERFLYSPRLHELRIGDGPIIAWILARPPYCDRGRWSATIEAPAWTSDADPWPRYYFDLERAKAEVLAYCKAKRINTDGADWKAQ